MEIFTFNSLRTDHTWLKKMLLVMKLTILSLFIALIHVSAASRAQRINLMQRNVSMISLFKEIKKQSSYSILYDADEIKEFRNVDVHIRDATIEQVFDELFKSRPLEYLIVDKSAVIRTKESPKTTVNRMEPMLYLGKIVNEQGIPIHGVTIKVIKKPQTTLFTTLSDEQGNFSVLCGDESLYLQFSSVGYVMQEFVIRDLKNHMTIVMKDAIGSLDQVQVLAYGTTSKRLNTGNVVTFSAEEIGKNPVPNVLQAMQNQIPGMFIQQNTGNLGGAFDIKIRGGSSLMGSGVPLLIVDGMQYPGTTLPFLGGLGNSNNPQNQGGNPLNYLSPGDIESVNILKDADATSIYGSRGAYGVILITTKKGKPGAPRFSVNAFDGISVRGNMPKMLNTEQYLMIRKEAFKNDGETPGVADLDLNGAWPADRYTDWRKYYLGNAAQDQNINFSYSGGNANTNFLIAGNLRNQRTIQKGTGGQIDGGGRFDINSTSVDKKFFIDLSGTYNLSRNNATPYDFTQALTNAPNAPLPVLPDGTLDWSTGANPAAALNATYLSTTNNFLTNIILKYDLVNHLSLNASVGFSLFSNKEFRALPTSYFVPSPGVSANTSSTINTFTVRTLTIDPNLAYNNKFFGKGTLDARVGITMRDANNSLITIDGKNFTTDALLLSPSSATIVTATYLTTPNRYIGSFVQMHLNWDNKYLLSLNARRDGSTSFGPDHRFGNFGSVAGAWIVSEEPWMKGISNVLSFAKIRSSYGSTGGDQISAYQYLNLFTSTGVAYSGTPGIIPSRISNPDLHWESKKSEELGVTLQFLKGRIEFDGSYYRNWTTDALFATAISSVTGFRSVQTNTPDAKLYSYGFEMSLNTQNIKNKNFSWRTNFNFSQPKSKLIAFPGLENRNSISLTNAAYVLGKPITGLRLFNYAGVNPQTGNYSFINAAGVKDDFNLFQMDEVTDRTQYIDLAPKYYGGIGNSFTYKRLSLDVFVIFTKRMTMNLDAYQTGYTGTFNQNAPLNVLNRWQKPGDITNEPKASQSFSAAFTKPIFNFSTGAYSDATYARLNNLNVNYDFGGQWLKKIHIQNLGLYLQAQNLLTVSRFKDLDPENVSPNSIGPLHVFVLGFKITL
jgi:TonB-linked SusC/RagA family outer membrane protein